MTNVRVGGASEGRRYVEMWFLSGWARAQCDHRILLSQADTADMEI